MPQVLGTVGRRVRGPAWSVGEMVARSIEAGICRGLTWGPGGVIVQDFGWVVLGHPEMGNT